LFTFLSGGAALVAAHVLCGDDDLAGLLHTQERAQQVVEAAPNLGAHVGFYSPAVLE
jgi:hypothetical protein